MADGKQSKSRIVPQNNDPEAAQRTLTDNDIEELLRFFQLLDEWDREHRASTARNAG